MPFGICTKPSKDDIANELRVCVELPDSSNLEVVLSRNSIGLECLEKIGTRLELSETRYFGLCYKTKKGPEWWLVLEKPIKKQLEQHGLNNVGNIELKFKIHFFIRDAASLNGLQDKLTRNFLYLQLKSHIIEGRLSCNKDTAVLLASYSQQAELGDYVEETHGNFSKDRVLLPSSVSSAVSEESLNHQITNMYKSHKGMSTEKAKSEYIKVTQKLEGYGDEYYPAKDKDGFIILVGATFLGVVVRHPHGLPPVYFRWPDVVRISHSKKYFCIESTKTFDTIQFEMEDAPTAKYVWRMFVAHHQFCRLNLCKSSSLDQKDSANPTGSLKGSYHGKTTEVLVRKEGNPSPCSSGSMEGICNPVFNEQQGIPEESNRGRQEMAEQVVLRESPSVLRDFPRCSRPASLNLIAKEARPEEFSLHGGLCNSEDSLNHSQGSYGKGLLSGVVTNKVGSSLSMDSGNPLGASDMSHGTQSLESLDERSHNTPPSTVPSLSPAGGRPSRPVSLNLEQLADNTSEVTGQTSGYSTSNDSDLDESRELEFDDEQPLTREAQLEELEKLLSEGQVFTEFQKVERRSENLAITSAQLATNLEKNRYKDVVPYEETRVHLNPRNNLSGNDYINANFVKLDVSQRTYRYIAAQGPMTNTAADFWQMVWEQDVNIVVAATDDKTNSKSACYPYWPEDLPESRKTFGAFQVETVAVRDTPSYKVRKVSIQHVSSNHKRFVSHLHFTDWPDHGVPSDPKNFLEFLEELESARQQVSVSVSHAQEVHPVVVHCTAGVGRTGVIILTDLMIACLQSSQPINILKSLINLRRQRMLLVANFGQYRFVYTTLIHFIRNSRLI